MDKDKIHHNLLTIYERYKETVSFRTGMFWYDEKGEEIRKIAEYYHHTPEIVAAMVAVTSPAVPWDKNIEGVESLLQGGTAMGYKKNIQKAIEIMNTGNLNLVSGQKVTSFYRNLLGDMDAVTIDRWQARIALNNLMYNKSLHEKEYKIIEEVHNSVSEQVGVVPARLQSGLWCSIREEFKEYVYRLTHGYQKGKATIL